MLLTVLVISVVAACCGSRGEGCVSAHKERVLRAKLIAWTMRELDSGCGMEMSVGKDVPVEGEKERKVFGHI